MNIKVLGSATVLSSYNSPAYLIDGSILLDVPNGCWKTLKRTGTDPNTVDDILITHFHADHFFDTPLFILNRKGRTPRPIHFYCHSSEFHKIPDLLMMAYPDLYDEVTEAVEIRNTAASQFRLGEYNVTSYEVQHGNLENCRAYVFDNSVVRVGFSGDSSCCSGLMESMSDCNYYFLECTLQKGSKSHIGIDDLFEIAGRFPQCRFFSTHISDNTREALLLNKPGNMQILQDGMVFNL